MLTVSHSSCIDQGKRTLTEAVLSVAAHCARGTSVAGEAVTAAGCVLSVENTVTRVVIDTSLLKLNNISNRGLRTAMPNWQSQDNLVRWWARG